MDQVFLRKMMRLAILLTALLPLLLPAAIPAAELPFHGFVEFALGARMVDDRTADDDFLLGESRFQVDLARDSDLASLQFRADLLYDGIERESRIEIREANILGSPYETLDLKVGRQIMTWGTGDFVFLNDLFPKDWQSFFIGRDDEYLKKPSNAVRASWFGSRLNLDLVWMPLFEPDTFISGERISFWDPSQGRRVGPEDGTLNPVEPGRTLKNSQLALRLYGNSRAWEGALYGFRGHYGQPKSFDPAARRPTFPRLEAWGASLRGPLFGGIAHSELAWYRSLDDLDEKDPNVPNSEIRVLVGFTHEVGRDQTLGLQSYLERSSDFPDVGRTERERWWGTLRYTGLFFRQNLILSWFSFYSPNEKDAYLRPKISYKASDEILLTLGLSLFWGMENNTFFGQFEDNNNIYARTRYSF